MRTFERYLGKALLIGAVFLLAAGGVLYGIKTLGAQEPPRPPLPLRSPAPRPDESAATDVAQARAQLSQNKDLAAVIQAAEAGDVEALLALATSGGDNYCGSYRELPPECSSRTEKLESVVTNAVSPGPIPVKTMREWLSDLIAQAGKPSLEFATRDSRTPAGVGGEYYLMFRTPGLANMWDGYLANGVGFKIKVGASKPIQWFVIAKSGVDSLNWIQSLDENGAKYHILITPPSTKGMAGIDAPPGPPPIPREELGR